MALLVEFYKSRTRRNRHGNTCCSCQGRIDRGGDVQDGISMRVSKGVICMRAFDGLAPRTEYKIYQLMHMKCFRAKLSSGMDEIKQEKAKVIKYKKERIAYLNEAQKKLKTLMKMKYHSTLGGFIE